MARKSSQWLRLVLVYLTRDNPLYNVIFFFSKELVD